MHDLKGREGSPSEKLFEHLGAEKTGVRYVKKVVSLEERPELAQSNSFSNLDQVVGVCAGDYDGDDHPDLFFSYPYGGHRLFRNLGGFRFEDPTEAAGLLKVVGNHWAVGCSFVDYDGDGDLDLFVAGVGDPNLLLENQGDGTFQDRAEAMGSLGREQTCRWHLPITTGSGADMELRDERVADFVRRLARGKHSLTYRLRAEVPGKFSALPANGNGVYAPELRANSDEMKILITDEGE
ncbi:MAG: FG-GAP-like repeat-containing protein [Roseibacillus sp.]